MRRLGRWLIFGAGVGAIIGALAGIRWIVAVVTAGGPGGELVEALQSHWLPVGFGMAASTACLLWIAPTLRLSAAIRAALGIGCYLLLMKLATVLAIAGVVGHDILPWARGLALVSGDTLATQGLSYAPPPSLGYYLRVILSLVLLGCCIGACFGTGYKWRNITRSIFRCGLIGGLAAGMVSLSQTLVLIVAMRSGQNPASVVAVAVIMWFAGGILAVLTGYGWAHREAPRLFRWSAVGLALISIAYIAGGLYGYGDYAAMSRLHPDGSYTYIQFRPDGSWRRTLDQAACSNRTRAAQDFVIRYASSAYRPAAELVAAQSLFEEWRFKEAGDTLRAASNDYPMLEGYRDVLWGCADLASGRPGTFLRTVAADSYLARWRRTIGAQTAADAAARLGLPRRSYGLHSAYLDYLATGSRSAWSCESSAFSRSAMDALPQRELRGLQRGTAVIRVVGPEGAVRGARVVLVQPHVNVAFPSDSGQFTGAWTIPAWDGSWGETDNRGVAVIRGLPCGAYEVVLGMSPAVWPARTVAGQGPSTVVVQSARAACATIQLVPAIKTLSPSDGGVVAPSTVFHWRAYPRACSYSVSVMEVIPSSGLARGVTCWAKTGILGDSTVLDGQHFVSAERLRSGRSYMWLVYAHGSDGKIISSSEHYFELREPSFTIRVPSVRKGGSER